jgi:hypothetical protein
MAPDGSPLIVLAQQGVEAANFIVAEKSVGVPRREPSIGDNNRVRRARSEAASSTSPNHCMSEHDARRSINQSRAAREYDHERYDLRNAIEDRRCLSRITPSSP